MADRWRQFSLKFANAAEAKKAIKDSATAFYFLGALTAALGYFLLGVEAIIDGLLFAVLGFWMQKRNSLIAASLLVLDTGYGIYVTLMNQVTNAPGGRNVVLAFIAVTAALRAFEAIRKLPSLEKDERQQPVVAA
jgi:hypothetical protein